MSSEWNDRDEDHESWRPGDGDVPSEPTFGDPDAWRGSAPGDDREAGWRGEVHLEAWPEWSAGPEYLMWKRLADGGA